MPQSETYLTISHKRPRRARMLRWFLAFVLIAALLTAITGWLVLEHKPGWYKPVAVTAELIQHVRVETTRLADEIGDKTVQGETFEIELSDVQTSQWLAALPEVWPRIAERIPLEIGAPSVHFGERGIYIGIHYEQKGFRVIFNVLVAIEVSQDGESLVWRVLEVNLGSLAVPRSALRKTYGPYFSVNRGEGESPLGSVLEHVRSIDELFEGVRIRNHFIWPNGRRRFRIGAITLSNGSLKLKIDPL